MKKSEAPTALSKYDNFISKAISMDKKVKVDAIMAEVATLLIKVKTSGWTKEIKHGFRKKLRRIL